jgi:small conductance mechanosensitive channel
MPPVVTYQVPFPALDPYIVLRQLVAALLVMGAAYFLARWSRRGLKQALLRARADPHVVLILENLVYFGLIAVGILIALPLLGIPPEASVTVFGVAGLAISLALRDVLSNLVAGLYILIERPFRIGDRIELPGGHRGEVETIALRTTMLRTENNMRIIVPNATIYSSVIVNRSAYPAQRGELLITVAPGEEDLRAMKERLEAAVRNVADLAAEPAPVLWLEGIAGGKATFRLRFWAPSVEQAMPQVVWELRNAAPEADITAPK